MELYEAIRKRVAVHGFKSTPVPRDLLLRILEAGAMAPSPENYQPWEFVIIDEEETKKQLTELKLQSRKQVLREWFPKIGDEELEKRLQRNRIAMESATTFVAVCYKDMDSKAETGDQRISLSSIAAWTCVAYVWLAAASEGLGLSPAFYSQLFYERAKSLIGLPRGYELAAVLRIGYPLKRPLGQKKTVARLETKIHENRF
jgi:5,6-dimethylbenzimidazole synthase